MMDMLARASQRVQPATICDVGASDGRWSAEALRFWPAANVILIEADERHRDGLEAFCAAHPNARAVHALADDHCGEGHFASDHTDPFGGQGSSIPRPDTRAVNSTTVDAEVARSCFPGPYLLKLDTHGFEVQILDGAIDTLANCCALVIEAYTCKLQPGALTFGELAECLAGLGFVATDIADIMRRPIDGRWWQCDLLFERAGWLVGEPRYK
jgi:FkbM family methyltransferase